MGTEPSSVVPPETEGRPVGASTSYQLYEGTTTTTAHINSTEPTWQVWLRWVLFTVAGYVLSWSISTAPVILMPESGGQILGLVLGLFSFVLVGLAQWLVLKRYLRGITWWGWTLATMLGQFLRLVAGIFLTVGLLLFDVVGDLPEIIGASATLTLIKVINGFLLGLPLGFAQWVVLRRYVSGAAWWIPVVAVGAALNSIMPLASGMPALLLSHIAGWTLFAEITGIVLVWFLGKPRKLQQQEIRIRTEQPVT